MQYQPQPIAGQAPQLSLFEGLIAHRLAPFANMASTPQPAEDCLSEMTLSGSGDHCRLLLAPILREFSEAVDTRWLTLIAPPASLSQSWLREAGLNRDRILLLQARETQATLELACKALMSGCSHTVITWFPRLDKASRLKLRVAAAQGNAQSLNIRLG
ncbi:CDP-glycerol--UDP-pyrophosphoryl-N-acetylglucosaminyl-N-acetylmannosamine glycerophosphotransferase [Stutzerimonas stutzeri]|uniref:CDP-glycerol--UDP-pyrophosphoryl-N-acetylglucosaminyl-N-acetylmannosamine glycerophosphotransferase n=1 Tax=Stutzerimonas stutzeri TaxID=316 RepID=W8R0I7_STUST|nr:SOS-induced cell division inhibitor SulA [Stutzerimonas stutzeri]AHL76099.1 CDP-glycerol--UDP-pyrophosphoryl-N-acetylglucosaminyl-N-acetylmannosamine glycerophosphotransferase [Stutzerimonas stutzeri]MCQ4330549.1 SulA-like leucine-rich domain-containing protein [Stutzerimonas stutzeri]